MPVKHFLKSPSKIDFTAITKLNQGAGSGLDSDLLDGLHGAAYEQIINKGVANGYAPLGADGKVSPSYLPLLALTKVYTVVSETAQLALTAEEGDVAIRTDLNRSYARNTGASGTMADWSELLTPTDSVLSFNTRTGAVMPETNDYTWGQIDKAISNLADITTKSHTVLSDIGTNTHVALDNHVGASAGVHGVAGSIVGTTDIQTLLNKILQSPKIKDVDATPVDDVLLKVIDGVLKVRNSADSAGAPIEVGRFYGEDNSATSGKPIFDMLNTDTGVSTYDLFRVRDSWGGITTRMIIDRWGGLKVGNLILGQGSPYDLHQIIGDGGFMNMKLMPGGSQSNYNILLIPKGTGAVGIGSWGGGTGNPPASHLLNVKGRLTYVVPTTAPTDADLIVSQISAWLDESNSKLKFRIKKSDGTLVTAELAYA